MAPAGSVELGSALSRAGAAPPPLGAWRPFPSACCCCFSALLDVNSWLLFYGFLYLALYAQVSQSKSCDKISCFSGHCVNSTCVCDQGWVGDQCQHCQGRFKLTEPSGYLTDGPINYKYKTKCTWLIEGYWGGTMCCRAREGADHGLIVPEVRGNETVPEVVTTSGYALLHFFSDAAYNLTGFNIFYSINSCPNNCSEHGKCTTSLSIPSRVYCECDKYWKGEACDIPYCKANCGSPDHGYCDLTGEKLCVCNDSWQGKGLLFGIKSIFNANHLLCRIVLKTSTCTEAKLKQIMAMLLMSCGFSTSTVKHGVSELLPYLCMASSMLWKVIQHTSWSWTAEMWL
uniref:EGF-like domain-containing protein n=1 Tax=Pavo cristatus TaxID=9049 RepID=A0A8C9G3V3_PAVCR